MSANEYLLKSEQISYPISIKTLKKLYTEQNFTLASFNEGAQIISEFSLPASSVKYAFMFVSKDHKHKYVFYRDDLNSSDKIYCSAYFLGKIYLEKLTSGIFPLAIDSKNQFETSDSAARFAIEILAPTALLNAKNIHTLLQIKNFTALNNNYCLEILKNLRSEQESELSADVAKYLIKKIRPNTKAIIVSVISVCIIALLCTVMLLMNIKIKETNSQKLQWYVDTTGAYHKYSDCHVLREQLFVKGPVTKSLDEIKTECSYCKERRLRDKKNAKD